MGSKLTFLLLLYVSLHAVFVFGGVISPSQINLPVLHPGDDFSVYFVSDSDLFLVKNSCTSINPTLVSNKFAFTISDSAIYSVENCEINVAQNSTPSLIFVMPLRIVISSNLSPNISISYDEQLVIVKNTGNGRAVLWVVGDNQLRMQIIEPKDEIVFDNFETIKICNDSNCSYTIFNHKFVNKAVIDSGKYESVEEKRWYQVIYTHLKFSLFIFISIVLLIVAVLYFARRFSTLFKNTS